MYLEERVSKLEGILRAMLEEHPEFCPHNWEWQFSRGKTRCYVCSICGRVMETEEE